MPAMLSEVYDALREAGASEDKSRAAARAVADFDARFQKLEFDQATRQNKFEADTKERFVRLEGDLTLLKWMVGAVLAGVIALIARAFALG